MFSRYDVYTTVQSVYCYSGTSILKNKLNIHESAKLKEAEEELTAVKQMVLLENPIKGYFTKNHLLRIYKFLFEDVYPFAGHVRRESISKGSKFDISQFRLQRICHFPGKPLQVMLLICFGCSVAFLPEPNRRSSYRHFAG